MPDEAQPGPEGTGGEPQKPNAVVEFLANTFKLSWLRPLFYNLGGRKMVLGGGTLVVLERVFTAVNADAVVTWPEAAICITVGLVSVGTAFTIAMEDGKTATVTEEKK